MSKDNGELPPPITAKSSRADMWEEIQGLRTENAEQQGEICRLRMQAAEKRSTPLAEYQMTLIRAIVTGKA
jgi:hypothetical protein